MNRCFWLSYTKWYKFYNNNLWVILESKHGGYIETQEPQTQGLGCNSITDSLTQLVLTFLFTLPERKVRKCLKYMKIFETLTLTLHGFLGGGPTSMCHFFWSSIYPSVAHHISGTAHHLIILFGTHMFCSIFQEL